MGVLTERAAKVFRFEEQNQLHEEIIDTGLAQIYQSHLEVAERMASDLGVEVKKTLLDGKAFQKVLDHVRKTNPWLLVLGRIGVHSAKDEKGLGSNTENLLRACRLRRAADDAPRGPARSTSGPRRASAGRRRPSSA